MSEFKIGDRVVHKEFGDGTVVDYMTEGPIFDCVVEFDSERDDLHDGSWFSKSRKSFRPHSCWYCHYKDLQLIEEPSDPLLDYKIELAVKMLSVYTAGINTWDNFIPGMASDKLYELFCMAYLISGAVEER